jgi:hypothetical protein
MLIAVLETILLSGVGAIAVQVFISTSCDINRCTKIVERRKEMRLLKW